MTSDELPILNADHAQYEIENANTPKEERSDWPYASFDARDWAKAFCKVHPTVSEDDALGWFANALMRGYDHPRTVPMQEMDEAELTDLLRLCIESQQLENGSFKAEDVSRALLQNARIVKR